MKNNKLAKKKESQKQIAYPFGEGLSSKTGQYYG